VGNLIQTMLKLLKISRLRQLQGNSAHTCQPANSETSDLFYHLFQSSQITHTIYSTFFTHQPNIRREERERENARKNRKKTRKGRT
jgi:hypothetical protein